MQNVECKFQNVGADSKSALKLTSEMILQVLMYYN